MSLAGLAGHRPGGDDVDRQQHDGEHEHRLQQPRALALAEPAHADAAEDERDQQDQPAEVGGDPADPEPVGLVDALGISSQPSFE